MANFQSVDEQLAYIKKGAAEIVKESELRSKIERSLKTGKPLRVKAGFDLSRKFEINVAGQDVNIRVPKATILSVEPLSLAVDELRDGLWNKIQPQDIDRELEKMPELARAKAGSLPVEAEQTFERLVSQKLGDFHVQVQTQSDTGLKN